MGSRVVKHVAADSAVIVSLFLNSAALSQPDRCSRFFYWRKFFQRSQNLPLSPG